MMTLAGAWFSVASRTLASGFEVGAEGFVRGIRPRPSRRQRSDTTGQRGEADLVGIGGRQGDLDPGDQLGDAAGHLDQAETDRIELGVAPERVPGSQTAQAQQQPISRRMDQQAELVGRRPGAGGAVGGEVQLVRLDQVFSLSPGAIELLI